jgi:branched-chain amino acid transport system ATP-binding protein
MLKLNNIEVIYSNVILVLKGISIEVPDGKVVALLGANGAGKTTTLKAISGLLSIEDGRVTDGTMEFDGKRIDNGKPEVTVKMGIAQIIEGRIVFPHLTIEENLLAGAFSVKDRARVKKDLDLMYTYFPRLKQLKNKVSGFLSGGEQQMLVIGSALMSLPKLLLLDEPSLGLSPIMVREIFSIIRIINEEKKTSMLLVEQNARAALDLATYGYVMENGRIVLDGPTDKLRDNEDIKEFYLGLSEVGSQKSYRDVKHYRRRKRWLG